MYAKVLIEYNSKLVDRVFTYIVPMELNDIRVGNKVLVSFNNRVINGIVLSISNDYNEEYNLQSILEIVDKEFYLNEELIKLGEYISSSTFCTKICAYQSMLPSSKKIKSSKSNYEKYISYIEVIDIDKLVEYKDKCRSLKVKDLIDNLISSNRLLKSECDSYSVKSLVDKDIIRIVKEQVYRLNEVSTKSINELTKEQFDVFNSIELNTNKTYLLKGITGSGKTEVYMSLIKEVISNGKSVILLVPEITLSTQIVSRFYDVFGSSVAILHSGLSESERNDEYLKIYRGEVNIVVGARSAIFAPLVNLGLVIVDEEHSDSYKQDTNPRYNAIEMALFRCNYNNIPLVLGSATPSLESMARAKKGVYKLLELNNRIGNSILPRVEIVDMSKEYRKGNFMISDLLDRSIRDRLSKGEQVMLLLNRRGHSTNISCSNCGYVYKCKNCDITLTYHKSSNMYRCHYCGYSLYKSDNCPECNSDSMNYLGLGTEKLCDELCSLYSSARIVRMDSDTTSSKGSHKRIIDSFSNGEYDILVGTQMISKGLDFSNVTLVGVIDADSSLNIPDFRSVERTYSLLEQVSGRAGRGDKEGLVLIQSTKVDNNALLCVKDHDYDKFYELEMSNRRLLGYPPYYYLCMIKVASKSYDIASSEIGKINNYLKKNIDSSSKILGPSIASNFKVNNVYRFQIIIKYKKDDNLFNSLIELNELYSMNRDVYLEIDNNPLRI